MSSPQNPSLARFGLDKRVEEARDALLENELQHLLGDIQLQLVEPTVPTGTLPETLERVAWRTGAPDDRRRLHAAAWACRRDAPIPQPGARRAWWLLSAYADALLGQQHLDLRMWTHTHPLDELCAPNADSSWPEQLASGVAHALLLIARQDTDSDDLQRARDAIAQLRRDHNILTASTQDVLGADSHQVDDLLLVGVFNVARLVELLAEYLQTGAPADIDERTRQHISQIDAAVQDTHDARAGRALQLAGRGLAAHLELSAWAATANISARLDEHIRRLHGDPDNPLVELWPSQRAGLRQGLANAAKRAVVIETPTSSGKSLLGQLAIVQLRAGYPQRTAAYVVPTRALVNQVARDLRHGLGPEGLIVEAAAPMAELDAAERPLLSGRVDVLVSTPEKLDLLVRTNHPALENLGLVVVDEAHLIRDVSRGARLELLLANLRGERSQVRFVLLTPFAEGAHQLADWLGGDDGAQVESAWRPTQRAVVLARTTPRTGNRRVLELETVDAGHQSDFTADRITQLGSLAPGQADGHAGITRELATRAARRGGVLILAASRASAHQHAVSIDRQLPDPEQAPSELLDATAAFADLELGPGNDLAGLLRHQVAYHHAGLSPELRQLIELNARQRSLHVIAGTTTLAAGVNFPIGSVIFDALGMTGAPRFSHAEFWNIAGRAGRARLDRLGLVAVSCGDEAHEMAARGYFTGTDASNVSALIEALETPGLLSDAIDERMASQPALGTLLQYLNHAVQSAGEAELSDRDVDDVLQRTLVYRHLLSHRPELAQQLKRFTDRYLSALPGALVAKRADGTGFTTPAASRLTATAINEHPEWRTGEFWQPTELLTSETRLASAIDALNRTAEINLNQGSGGTFDPRWTARVARDWVAGASVSQIAAEHFTKDRQPVEAAGNYLYSRLSSNLSWGLGALQRIVMNDDPTDDIVAVPSLVFYGVSTARAAQLRMAGAFRPGAERLAALLDDDTGDYVHLRRSLLDLPADSWSDALGFDAPLSGQQAKTITAAITGT